MVVDEIYNALVVKFGIGEVFLPKYGKRREVSWKEFIKTAIEVDSRDKLSTYCEYSNIDALNKAIRKRYLSITKDKNGGRWNVWLPALINKKKCFSCDSILGIENFNKSTKYGLQSTCRACESKTKKIYTEENKEAIKEKGRKYYQENKEEILEKHRVYRILNKEEIKLYRREYIEKNRYLFRARDAKRRASKLLATPNWANLITIKEIYRTCPTGYHVDHIVPLQGKLVCGLHCEFNLQHLPARENLSKGNRFEVC